MVKFRIIPSILTDGSAQVKGTCFDNWRSVGSVTQAVKVHAARGVDEILLLDVNATREGRLISPSLVRQVAQFLRIPFAVGGGISSVADVSLLLEAGADKIVLGTAAVTTPGLVGELAGVFGSQAVVCSIDCVDDSGVGLAYESGTRNVSIRALELGLELQRLGAGELLLQNVSRDGLMGGVSTNLVAQLSKSVSVPVIAGSGISSGEDVFMLAAAGASAAAVGALFQFTHETPGTLKKYLFAQGILVRR